VEKEFNVQIRFATNGQEAIDLIARRTPSLALFDMEMPVMDGYTAVARIRTMNSQAAELPIIALTAHQGDDEAQKCLDAGCTAYLSKPIQRSVLLGTIASFIHNTERPVPEPAAPA
jgi:CheY-like chemotaxis protein